jgi:alpha-glucosidase
MAWLDFSKTSTRTWWEGQHSSFLNMGIDGIWNDLNEPDELGGAWPLDVKYNFDGNPVNHNKTAVQYSLLQAKFSYETLAAQFPNQRPWVLSRGGYAGIQRYSALWSGDNGGDWNNDYKRNIPMGLSMSISGVPNNGHDIGGFFGHPTMDNKPSNELYARWMQSGVFSPFCRQHHDGFGNRANPPRPFVEPWQFGTTVENICRDFIGLRYRLMPYLYTLFFDAYDNGAPIQRPTLYDFPADANTLTQNHDFMFGPWMLVSPVTTPGAANWSTYLPAGTQWINWWTDSIHNGGASTSTSVPLDRVPIYVRAGAIIPTGPIVQYDGQAPLDPLTIECYPTGGESSFTLYEDDGISWAFQSGGFAQTTYTMSGIGDTFALHFAAREGGHVPAARNVILKLHRWPGQTTGARLDNTPLVQHATKSSFDGAASGYYHDTAGGLLWAKFADSGSEVTFRFAGTPVPNVPGDFDLDGDVDMADFGKFQVCLSGAGIEQSEPDCQKAMFDADVDVDSEDLTAFLGCLSGPDIPSDPACAR